MAVTRIPGVLTDDVDGQTFLIGAAGTHVIELNDVGSVIWAAIDGSRDIEDLVQFVQHECPGADQVPTDQVRADVFAFLEEIARLQLVTH